MADANNGGDAISRLVQLLADRAGVTLRWTGTGREDVALLCTCASNAQLTARHLWDGLMELNRMKEFKTLPEAMQAKIAAIVLQAHGNIELARQERNERAQQRTKAAGPGAPGAPVA
jgi:hypothetical protein